MTITCMRRRAAAGLLLLGVTTACTGSHAPRPAAVVHAAGAPVAAPSDWRRALHVHHGGILQPTLPPSPPVDCSTQLCAEASDPVGPVWLRGDAHLDGGCVWGVATQGVDSERITLIWPVGTYATFGRVIQVFDKAGKLLA